MMYVITEWFDRYEVNKDGGPAKKEDKLRANPLSFIRWKVHGHSQGPGWRILTKRCKSRTLESFGFFGKLLELAGDNPADKRGGIIRDDKGRPATAEYISFALSQPLKKVQRCLDDLIYVGWIEQLNDKMDNVRREDEVLAEARRASPRKEDVAEPFKNETKRKRNRIKTEGLGEHTSNFQVFSNSSRLEFDDKLRRILPPTTNSDRTAFRNLGLWLSNQGGNGRVSEQVLEIAQKARMGRKPMALFFSMLDEQLGYRPRAIAIKEKENG